MKTLDSVVFLIYFFTVASYRIYIYSKIREGEVSSKDYFLAEGSRPWWAIGASHIASIISAEQLCRHFTSASGKACAKEFPTNI